MTSINILFIDYENTPYGKIVICCNKSTIIAAIWENNMKLNKIIDNIAVKLKAQIKYESTTLSTEAKTQISEYFNGERDTFSLPLQPIGTEFQNRIWGTLKLIQYGKTCSYSDIAKLADKPNAVRSTASAIASNPLAIFIPCHRIIPKNGTLGQYNGGTAIKHHLLQLESQ